jgi:hypothetical protein
MTVTRAATAIAMSPDLAHLRTLSREALSRMFHDLPAPLPGEMQGEFDGVLPDFCDAERRAGAVARAGAPVHWLGKAYRADPADPSRGDGHNRYRGADVDERRLPFAWAIGPSWVDGRPALVMRYSAFDHWAGKADLQDEIRVCAPGLYLAVAHTREPIPAFTPLPGPRGRSLPEPFFLIGPLGPYVDMPKG